MKIRGVDALFAVNHEEVKEGDVGFYLGCVKITPPNILAKNKKNLIVLIPFMFYCAVLLLLD